jgi:ferredoxin--NADP+ reductase
MARTRKKLNAIVTQRVELAPGLIVLRVVPDGWELPDFTPGQFTALGLPGAAPRCKDSDPECETTSPDRLITRAYSIASSSQAKEYLEFYINLIQSGALTPRIFHLKTGDRIWLSRKCSGLFTLDEVPPDKNLLLICTGTGVAPYMSMIRSQLTYETRQRLAVVHGARHSWDLGYRSELESFQRLSRHFVYLPMVSRPAEELTPWKGESGYVQDIWNRRVLEESWKIALSPENTHVFLCGNPVMIETMQDILEKDGYREHLPSSAGEYHVEKYW